MTNTHEARIETSTMCNYRCTFCPHKNGFTRKKEIMSNSDFNIVMNKISELPQINTITFSGMGEILIDKNILYKMNKANLMGYKTNLLTNGSLLTKELIRDFDKVGLNSIRISLHTVDSSQYQQITGASKEVHEHVMDMIEYLIPRKIETIISCDIIKVNEDNVQDIIQKYEGRVDLLEIWKPHNWTNWADYRQGQNKKKTCGRPENGPLQIQVDGTMNMCCFDYNGELTIGDLMANSVEEIYQSHEYLHIRNCHQTGNMENLLCSQCDQLQESDPGIVIYNSKFDAKDRINKTSTNYEEIE